MKARRLSTKVTFFTCVLAALLTLTPTQRAPADYTILNGRQQDVYIIVSTWMKSKGDIPAGYQTNGYYKITPGDSFTIKWGSSDYYIKMYSWVDGTEYFIKPRNSATRSTYKFWTVPKDAFKIVENSDGKILYSSSGMQNLTQTGGFYKYQNGGTFSITEITSRSRNSQKPTVNLRNKNGIPRKLPNKISQRSTPSLSFSEMIAGYEAAPM